MRVFSAYEAAAEVLSAPILALVIELGAMTRRHLRLLEIARRMDVQMIGVGQFPAGMSAGDLSGIRLVASGALGELIAGLAGKETQAPAAADAPAEAAAAPQGQPAPAVMLAPAKRAAKRPPADEQVGQWQSEPPPPKDEKAADSPQGLLTPEELRALLEDEP